MITNIKIELGDHERRMLASFLAGKPVKRLATRKEITECVGMLLTGFVDTLEPIETKAPRGIEFANNDARQAMASRGIEPGTKAAQQYLAGWFNKLFNA